MVRQYHQLNGYEFEQTQEDSEGKKTLAYCSPWGHKESDMIQPLRRTVLKRKKAKNRATI